MEWLRELCNRPGVAGHEDRLQAFLTDSLAEFASDVRVDRMGNIIALRPADAAPLDSRPLRIMVAAHMDEIGFLVKHIDDQGFVRLVPLGGFDPVNLVAQRVLVHGRRTLNGVIAPWTQGPYARPEKRTEWTIGDLYVDLGLGREEVGQWVEVGDVVSLDQDMQELNEDVLMGRNFDDRLGVYILVEALRRLTKSPCDVYFVATAQEELGVRGAPVAAHAIQPDISIALDGSLAFDVPTAAPEDRHCRLGGGPGIYRMDRLTLSHRQIVEALRAVAQRHGVPYQINLGGGTDASAMQRTGSGSYACTIGPPVRYMHSVVQLCHKADLEQTVELLRLFLEEVEPNDFIT